MHQIHSQACSLLQTTETQLTRSIENRTTLIQLEVVSRETLLQTLEIPLLLDHSLQITIFPDSEVKTINLQPLTTDLMVQTQTKEQQAQTQKMEMPSQEAEIAI
jgi:hypothetical protein